MIEESISVRHAAVVQLVSKYLNVFIQLALMAILARIISPDEFGVVAFLTVFLNFFLVLSDFGIGPAIVQYRELTEEDHWQLFVFSLVLGMVLTAGFCGVSLLVGTILGKRAYIGLFFVSSGSIFLNTLNMVPNGLLLKGRKFVLMAFRLIVASFISGAAGVLLALRGYGAFALVWMSVIGSGVVLIWNCFTSGLKIGPFHFVGSLLKVVRFSGFQAAWGVVNYFSRNLDNLLIGGMLGSVPLAYYDKAYRMTTYPVNYLPGVLSSVLQPYLSEFQDQPKRVFGYYVRLQKGLFIIGVLIASVCFVSGRELILIMFGSHWINAAPLFRALSLSIGFQMANTIASPILQSLGRTDFLFRHICIATGITILFLFVGLAIGNLTVLAYLIAASYCLHSIPLAYYTIHRSFHSSIRGYVKLFAPDFLSLLVIISIVEIAFRNLSLEPGWSLLLKSTVCLLSQCVLLCIFREWHYLRELVGR